MTTRTADGEEVLEDGESIVVRMHMMDSVQRAVAARTTVVDTVGHRPGNLALTDADADRQRRALLVDAYDRRVGDAWKNPTAVLVAATNDKAPRQRAPSPAADREAMYSIYDRAVSERWRALAA